MKEKLVYIIAGLVIYFIGGLLVSYIGMSAIDWKFVIGWTISMTLFDYFLLRRFRKWMVNRQNSKTISNER